MGAEAAALEAEGQEAGRLGLPADHVDRGGDRVAAVEEAAGPLEHLDPLDVVELVEADLGLGRAVDQHEAVGDRVEAAHDEEVGHAALRLDVDAADVLQRLAEDGAALLLDQPARSPRRRSPGVCCSGSGSLVAIVLESGT